MSNPLIDHAFDYLKAQKSPLLFSLIGVLFHVSFTKGTFKDTLLKIASGFLGALVLAPVFSSYFNLDIKTNNVVVLALTFATYYIIKSFLKLLAELANDPKKFISYFISQKNNLQEPNKYQNN